MKRLILSAVLALTPALALAQGLSGNLVLYTSQPNTDA
jgi:iron(III) transport system substrate-binding protein